MVFGTFVMHPAAYPLPIIVYGLMTDGVPDAAKDDQKMAPESSLENSAKSTNMTTLALL